MSKKRLSIGLECDSISQRFQAFQDGYDFIAVDVLNRRLKERCFEEYSCLTNEDVCIQVEEVLTYDWKDVSCVFAFASPWIEIDSQDQQVADRFIQILYDEVQYVSYIGISDFILPPLTQKIKVPYYARIVNHLLLLSTYIRFYVFFSIEDDLTDSSVLWDIWNVIRISCNYSNRLFLAFKIQRKLPEPIAISRWFSEPVGLLILSSDIFVSNSKGYPVLSKVHRDFYTMFAKLKPSILLRMSDEIYTVNGSLVYLEYLKYLEQNMEPITAIERFADGYQDYLQVPLQPLADNLESLTYSVFEKDFVKYNLYESAIYRALMNRPKSDQPIYLAVVGAGRGPLISVSLKAADRANHKIVLYAIEKNPNAFVTLQHRNRYEWNNAIHLVNLDMRLWESPVLIDIIISELLGSFGDNELCPECLDSVQKFLNPNGGIFIPSSYTSYVTPLMTPKLYGNILRMKECSAFESFYVIWLYSMHYLVQDSENRFQELWKFSHPNSNYSSYERNSNFHNKRQSNNTFNISSKGMLHGFAGYFEAVLYDDIELSTRPDMIDVKSKDMVSWFPAFFPLKTPLYVPSNSQIDLYFWRQTDSKKVWYEWLTEIYLVPSEIKNNEIMYNSERIKIAVSDLHNYNASFFSISLS
ncbi:hypothetical protein PMAC_002035 [Pneumocystis sp. 'macacae']|nr:hypothetical protein PMAC_002035 [Pneumocystis sp. 'macacae']